MTKQYTPVDMERVALRVLVESGEPVGARRLSEVFRQNNIDVAEATAGRLLRSLGEAGYAETVGMRGRVLTPLGHNRLTELEFRNELDAHSDIVARAIEATSIEELVDLLHVRRAVEAEAARLAAVRATDNELAAIVKAAADHVNCVENGPEDRVVHARGFHALVGQASHNRMIAAMIDMLLDPKNDPLQRLLDQLSLKAGVVNAMSHEHESVAEALCARDPVEAERRMRAHIESMIAVTGERMESQGAESAANVHEDNAWPAAPRIGRVPD